MKSQRSPRLLTKNFSAVAGLLTLASVLLWTGCQGVSTGGTGQGGGNLALGAQSLNFGSVTAGSNKTLTVSITNTGNAAAMVSAASVSTKGFSVTAPALPISIEAGQIATFSVEFAPSGAGSFSGNVAFTTNVANSTLNLGLSGTGTATTSVQLTISPSPVAVGSVVEGTSGTAQGTLSASGGSVTVTAASTNNSAFTISGQTWPVTIAANKSIPFTVTFSPLTTGAASATLTVTSNATPTTTTATLTGTGTAAPTHTVSLSWNPSSSSNIQGYNIYRALYTTSCGSYSKINPTLNAGTTYTDSSVVDGKAYCYASTAVNTSNEESTYSNIVSNVQIPAP